MFINPISSFQNLPLHYPSFQGRTWWDISDSQYLIHETAFFREPETDEFVNDYIRKNFLYKPEINIVSAGCATGEEAYTYAMLLDDLKDKVKIHGFDLSEKALRKINDGVFYISRPTVDYYLEHTTIPDYCNDSYLAFNSDKQLTERQIKYKEKFNKYFTEMKLAYSYFSDMENKTFFINPSLEKMCSFSLGDVTKLDDLFSDDSIDVFSMKNLLYHIVAVDDNNSSYSRSEKSNSEQIKREIFSSIHNKLKKDGLLVLGEHEYLQGIDPVSTARILHECGFAPVFTSPTPCKIPNASRNMNFPNVWQKI